VEADLRFEGVNSGDAFGSKAAGRGTMKVAMKVAMKACIWNVAVPEAGAPKRLRNGFQERNRGGGRRAECFDRNG
jgi:hypothetical protein